MFGAAEGMAKGGGGANMAGLFVSHGLGQAVGGGLQAGQVQQAAQQAAAAEQTAAAPAAPAGASRRRRGCRRRERGACQRCVPEVRHGQPGPEAKFCSNCGTALGPKQCANCGAEVPEGAKFCPECGTAQG